MKKASDLAWLNFLRRGRLAPVSDTTVGLDVTVITLCPDRHWSGADG